MARVIRRDPTHRIAFRQSTVAYLMWFDVDPGVTRAQRLGAIHDVAVIVDLDAGDVTPRAAAGRTYDEVAPIRARLSAAVARGR